MKHSYVRSSPPLDFHISDPDQHRRCLAASEAVTRYRTNARLSWREWTQITGVALILLRTTARQRVLEQRGRYEDHLSGLLQIYKLDDDYLDRTARASLLWIMDRLDEVNEWRNLQPDPSDLNNPQTVYRLFRARSPSAHDELTREKLADIALLTGQIKELQQRNDDLEWENAGLKQQGENGKRRGLFASGETEWYSPQEVIEPVRKVFGGTIDLDPASCAVAQRVVGATTHYTIADNGLIQKWFGRVYFNGPYDNLRPWVTKLLHEIELGHVTACIMLSTNNTFTEWFRLANQASASVCFPKTIRFLDKNGVPMDSTSPWGSAFHYFGPNPDHFEKKFCKLGDCVRMSRGYNLA